LKERKHSFNAVCCVHSLADFPIWWLFSSWALKY